MQPQHILQVSELTKKVRFILESELNTVWLSGEISNFVAASSGHWYLSLKDSRSQVRCAMFKGSNRRVRIHPQNGQQVLVRAKVSLYEPRGDFQLIIEQMEEAGEGLLRQEYEKLKAKLNAQGMFDVAHKQAIPEHITRVGIVTSATGAAVRDILSVLKRRNPSIEAIVYPVLVQGESAAQDIAQTIALANQRAECDVLIVGRGGGSLEDLWSFNEEVVVRAIYDSALPIISAVGHEIDTTLSDFVADLRAPTPSAAAELVSLDSAELKGKINQLSARLRQLFVQQMARLRTNQQYLAHRLTQVHPEQQWQLQAQKLDELGLRLSQSMQGKLNQAALVPKLLTNRLHVNAPDKHVAQLQTRLTHQQEKLMHFSERLLKQKQHAFATLAEQLHIVSPLATIVRGYSVTRNKQGDIVKSVSQVNSGDEISVQVADGEITAQVSSAQQKLFD